MNNQILNQTYIFNPGYHLREDVRRIIIYKKSIDPIKDREVSDVMTFIHPVHAIILSFFDGKKSVSEVLDILHKQLNLKKEEVYNAICTLIENESDLHLKYGRHCLTFPKKTLIKNTLGIQRNDLNPKTFFINKDNLDLESWRLYKPLDILFVINSVCRTNCIYCYADRRNLHDCMISIERLKELIKEARNLGIRSFDITGGEFFLYPNWEELLKELLTHDYTPYLSTKIPIDLTTIKKLKKIGIRSIQISIDSIVKDEIEKILRVKADYFPALLETIKNLDDNGIAIYTNSQMTKYNTQNIEKLIHFLLGLKNIKRINIGAAGFSLYNDVPFVDFRPELKEILRIEKLVNQLKNTYRDQININFSGYLKEDSYQNSIEAKGKNFAQRASCSGNFYALIIQPTGKVTVCEELYCHHRFIIGDLMTQSIEEVWNSKEALALYRLSKDSIQEGSVCKTCRQFEICRQTKGVCWKEVLYAYGESNWDYPDPRCPLAPASFREYYLKNE